MKRDNVVQKIANFVLLAILSYYVISIFNIYIAHITIEGLIYIVVGCGLLFFIQLIVVPSRSFFVSPSFFIIFLVVFSMAISILLQGILMIDAVDFLGRSSFLYVKTTYFIAVSWLLVGFVLSYASYERSNVRGIALALLAFFMVYYALDGGLVVSYMYLAQQGGLEALNHLFVGDGLIFIFFLAFSLVSNKYKLVVVTFGFVYLFMSGGRTALFLSIMAVYFYFIVCGGGSRKYAVIFGLLISGLFMGIGQLSNENELIDRMLFRQGITSDDSFIGRLDFFYESVGALPRQFFYGDPSLIVLETGSIGAYAHNILSAWQFYGFFAFIFLLVSLIYCGVFIFKNFKSLERPIEIFFILMFFYVFLCAVLSKFVGFYHLWMALGFWVAYIARHKMRGAHALNATGANHA